MIHVDLNIDSSIINAHVMEEIRTRLRSELLPLIFKVVDDTARRSDYRFSHRDVNVNGDIKLVEAK